jgi:hypothetical protein
VFTARYALSPYTKQIRFVFKGLNGTGEQQKPVFSGQPLSVPRIRTLIPCIKRNLPETEKIFGPLCFRYRQVSLYHQIHTNEIRQDWTTSIVLSPVTSEQSRCKTGKMSYPLMLSLSCSSCIHKRLSPSSGVLLEKLIVRQPLCLSAFIKYSVFK